MSKKRRPKRPGKISNVLSLVRKAVLSGNYIDMVHAEIRKHERDITRPGYEYVLRTGWHEKSKDEYKEEYKAWNYSIRGKTVDGRDLRVVISFDENGMLIITVIDLDI